MPISKRLYFEHLFELVTILKLFSEYSKSPHSYTAEFYLHFTKYLLIFD